ncbi:MAG: acetoacetate decarboxylase family protein, partial [Gaiellales bacterium]
GLDCRAEGRTFAGTLAANDRRLAFGTMAPEQVSQSGPTHNDPPLVNVRHFPRLAAGRHEEPSVHELVAARSRDRSISAIHEGRATLELYDAPGEEHTALRPVRMGKGFRFQFAYTVDDLETLVDYTLEPVPGTGVGS